MATESKTAQNAAGKGRKRRSDAVSRADVVRLRLLRLTTSQIAAELGVGQDCITEALREPEVASAIEEAEADAIEDAKRALKTLTRKAARVMDKALDSADERIALDAAKSVMTKAGADAPTKQESKSEHTGAGGAPLVPPPVPVTMAERRAQVVAELAKLDETARDMAELMKGGKR